MDARRTDSFMQRQGTGVSTRVFLFLVLFAGFLIPPAASAQKVEIDNFVVKQYIPVSLAPLAPVTVNENSETTATLSVSATEGEGITIAADTLPEGAAFDSSTRTFTYTPPCTTLVYPAVGQTITVQFTARDCAGNISSQSLPITVRHVNLPPLIATIPDMTVTEGQEIVIDVRADAQDGDPLLLSCLGAPAMPTGASFSRETRRFTWKTTRANVGQHIFHFIASDYQVPVTEEVKITVNRSNTAPVFNPLTVQPVLEGSTVAFTLTATDADNDPIVYSMVSSPPGAAFDPATRQFSWVAARDTSGGTTRTVEFRASDGMGGVTPLTVTITVIPTLPVNIPAGLSFFTPPRVLPTGYKASSLMQAIQSAGGQALFVARTGNSGKFEIYFPGPVMPDFDLEMGRAYLINANRGATVRFPDNAVPPATPVPIYKGLSIIPLYGAQEESASTLIANLNNSANQALKTTGVRYISYVVGLASGRFKVYVGTVGQGDFYLSPGGAVLIASSADFNWTAAANAQKMPPNTSPAPSNVQAFYDDITAKLSQCLNGNTVHAPSVMDIPDRDITVPIAKGKMAPPAPTVQIQVHAVEVMGQNLQYKLTGGAKNASINQNGLFEYSPSAQQEGTQTFSVTVLNANNSKIKTVKTFNIKVFAGK